MTKKDKNDSIEDIPDDLKKSLLPDIHPQKSEKHEKPVWLKSLSGKLYGILILFFTFILIISVFSWKSLLEVVNIQKILATKNIPELVLATNIVQQSERLIQSAPQLIASSNKDSINQVKKEIKQGNIILRQYLSDFEKSALSQNSLEIRRLINEMTKNLKSIEQSILQQKNLLQELNNISDQIGQLNLSLHKILVTEIDNKTFDLAVQSKAIPSQESIKSKPIQPRDILLYKELLNLQSQINIAVNLLREISHLSNTDLIQPIKERFIASIQSCEKAVKAFPKAYAKISSGIQSFKQFGLGKGDKPGVFSLKKQILNIEKTQKQYLEKNRKIANNLSETVQNINLNIKTSGQESEELFNKSIKKNQAVLFIINALSLIGCLIVAVFLVAPLIRRLMYLAKKMKTMSQGDLERKVKVEGNDEIAEMASALDLFRLYALEVQRLNLVEKLAKELQEKNEKLKETINNLHKTQDQLVIQEKLASLGQLTAGIAHEIKNPLNFITNFSKISKDLLKDIQEELQKVKTNIKEEVHAFLQEIMKDLQSNMEKISHHGGRANDIITGMLQHSKESTGQKELVNLNRYMEIYSNLAFHSKRASNSSFTVSFKKDFDKDLGFIEVVPQDISRIILNIVTNACDAIEEINTTRKNKDQDYCIWLKTKKTGDKAEIKIRDNGTGIPNQLKDKIFNPFFTTKDTGKGTGLGLSLTHDIVLKYGGTLSVESKEKEWTEFTVTVPIKKSTGQ